MIFKIFRTLIFKIRKTLIYDIFNTFISLYIYILTSILQYIKI